MLVSNQIRPFATRKTSAAHYAEIRRRVAKRGGTRHVQGGALKLQMPRNAGTAGLEG